MFTEYLQDRYIKLIKIYTHLYIRNLYNKYRYTNVIKKKYHFSEIYYNLNVYKGCKLSVSSLTFRSRFNKSIDYVPTSLKILNLKARFNHSIDFLSNLPHLKELLLIGDFDQPINKLPSSLEKLVLGFNFNYSFNFLTATQY